MGKKIVILNNKIDLLILYINLELIKEKKE
jgi:hypothetical protein